MALSALGIRVPRLAQKLQAYLEPNSYNRKPDKTDTEKQLRCRTLDKTDSRKFPFYPIEP